MLDHGIVSSNKLTVYYIVGQPRTGSTFVGDWVARDRQILNAGEVWQTFRTLGLVLQEDFHSHNGHWAKPQNQENKKQKIGADPFWSEVVAVAETKESAYEALCEVASSGWVGLVDCSKTDRGIQQYLDLGCRVVVIHTIRAYTTWARSMKRHADRQKLAPARSINLLWAYVRLNRKFAKYAAGQPYVSVPQEGLSEIDRWLDLSVEAKGEMGRYHRAEMFGTPNFSSTFSADRNSTNLTKLDRLLLNWTAGIDPNLPRPTSRINNDAIGYDNQNS